MTMFGGSGNDSLNTSGGTSITVTGGSWQRHPFVHGQHQRRDAPGWWRRQRLAHLGRRQQRHDVRRHRQRHADRQRRHRHRPLRPGGRTTSTTSSARSRPPSTTSNTFGQNQPQTDSLTPGINTIAFPGLTTGITLDLSNTSPGPVPKSPTRPGPAADGRAGHRPVAHRTVPERHRHPGERFHQGRRLNQRARWRRRQRHARRRHRPGHAFVAGSGNDSLVAGSGGTTFRFAGRPGQLRQRHHRPAGRRRRQTCSTSPSSAGAINLNLGSTSAQRVGGGSSGLLLTLQNPAEINGVMDTTSNDNVTGNASGDTFYVGTGNDTFTGVARAPTASSSAAAGSAPTALVRLLPPIR